MRDSTLALNCYDWLAQSKSKQHVGIQEQHSAKHTGKFFHSFSITSKLVVIIAAVATVISIAEITLFTMHATSGYLDFRRSRTQIIADIIGINCVPALTFHDREDAHEILQSIQASKTIRAAYLYDAEGGVLAEYVRDSETLAVPILKSFREAEYITDTDLIVVHRIEHSGNLLGALYIDSDLQDVREKRRDNILHGSAIGVTFFGLSILLALFVQRIFTRPLQQLSDTIERVSREKDYSLRVDIKAEDEFGIVADGFNSMIAEIEKRDNTLAAQMTMLEKANKELDQFVYAASHDLKAPLRAVESLSQLIVKTAKDALPPQAIEYLEIMQSRVQRMGQLLDDLLEYSRVGRIQQKVVDINCHVLVQEIVQLLGPPAEFVISLPDPSINIRTHRAPLEQVLRNLIGNAVKHHGSDSGHIEVTATKSSNLIEFSICDDGPGIDPRYHERIFQMFQTLRPRDEVEGSGMGLALVKKIVEDRRGKIWLRSAEGEGTCFFFTWPY